MELDELQRQWRRLDEKLDRSLALETELARRVVLQPARSRLHRSAVWPAIDLGFAMIVLLSCGAFLGDQGRDWRLAAAAGVVMIGVIALAADSIRQLDRVATMDWFGPVAEVQGSLERLRAARIRQFKWIILLSPLVGFCGLLVGLQWFFGWITDHRVNVLDRLDPWWVAANLILGVLFVPLGRLAARALSERFRQHRWWRGVLDGISGTALKAAALDLDRWASLQQVASRDGD